MLTASVPTPAPASEPDKNFGLTRSAFNELVTALRQGDERLLERIHGRQFRYCQQKLMTFDGLSELQAYDATMDALLHFRTLLLRDKVQYGNLRFLFVKIARQLYRKAQRKEGDLRSLTATDDQAEPLAEVTFTEAQFQRMESAFRQLGTDCRELLTQFYFQYRTLRDIAAEDGHNYQNLRKQKSRCVIRLRQLCNF